MKIHIIFLSLLYTSLAITVHYETTGSSNKNKEYITALKDIRLVPVNHAPDVAQKPITVRNKEATEVKSHQKSRGESKITLPNTQKFRGDKKNTSISRIGNTQNDQNHQNYMQKMANQLYMAQKHASVLSDYQKFILNQDPNVKNFVLAQPIQQRSSKPLSRQRSTGRAISASKPRYVTPEPVAAGDYKKIVVVTPKVQTTVRKITKPQNDYSAQEAHIKYVTLAPQSLTNFVESHEPSAKVTLVPFHSSQPYTYYDLGVTHQPQIESVQIPTTVSVGLGGYESPQIYKGETEHENNLHHDSAKYEFMYNVKDHEKHNHFGHRESRTDKATFGYYFVHLPDGRLETVKYWADKTGYHAKVDYQGEAKHPPHDEHKLHSGHLVHQ